ncbi:Ctr copper transporter family protein [Trichostrongylus colubriformis]|uniref:Copper transport protein n=1 Tax=Trichostrongylus colubriformis TaxID=6319 RepID=A0AAN8IEK5_TRICO
MGGRKMWMWFHTHVNDTLLFKDWWIQNAEKHRCFRWWSHLKNPSHYSDLVMYVVQMAMAYVLMLVFMTFSIWLCVSLCAGLAIGHYFFGTRRFKMAPIIINF